MSDPSTFLQPENLTKDRLKSELKRHGVSFDHNENKDYYVRLYRSKVSRQTGRRQRSEFSSDEEIIRRSPRVGAKKQPSKTASQSSYMAEVTRLSDEELAEALRDQGEEPGPVTDSTRGVYQRKLAKLMAEKTKTASRSREEVIDYGGGTEQVEEWSSHSSEEDTDQEANEQGQQEEEEEAGVMEDEETSMRLRSRATHAKTQHMAYVTYSTPTRHVESSYLLRKPKESTPKAGGAVGTSQPARQKPRKPAPSGTPHPKRPDQPPPPPPASSLWSSLLSFFLLLVMFSATFLAYDHYTASENESFFSQATAYLASMGITKNAN